MLTDDNIALYAFRRFGDTALRFALCCTQHREEAEDIAQDVFWHCIRAHVHFMMRSI